MRIKLKELAKVIGGELKQGNPELLAQGVSTDSRELEPGQVFFALRGERFDGHQFVKEVAKKGAFAAVVKRDFKQKLPKSFGLIFVSDPLFALGELARYQRVRLGIKVIGITGSVGKTTTKEMVALVLSQKFKIAKSEGNFNNLIGLPLTLFQIPAGTEVAVLEMATNQPGEIARLSEIAQPEIGVITRISEAHLLGLGDLEGVEREKRALVSGLGANGIFVFNVLDSRLLRLALGFAGRKVGFGLKRQDFKDAELEVFAEKIQVKDHSQKVWVRISGKEEGQEIIWLRGLGEHLVEDALGAIAVGAVMGISLKQSAEALLEFEPMQGRGRLEKIGQGLFLLDESYNANPASMKEALRVFGEYSKKISGRKILVLGEMKELGAHSRQAHYELGQFLKEISFDQLFYLGDFEKELKAGLGKAERKKLILVRRIGELRKLLHKEFEAGLKEGLILVKASNATGLSAISHYLKEHAQAREGIDAL